MDQQVMRKEYDDFRRFCDTLDIERVVRNTHREGQLPGNEKELYALAILRAARTGALGEDSAATRVAISALWERGSRHGFSRDNFNQVFERYFRYW